MTNSLLKFELSSKTLKKYKIGGHTKFSLLTEINRPVNPSHVSKIAKSIETLGILRPIIIAEMSFILGKKEKYIIDGQHFYTAAVLRLNLDIPYIQVEIKDMRELAETMSLLNNSSKSWSTLDYIGVWANISEDYRELLKLYNTYDIELLQIAQICIHNYCKRTSDFTSKSIKTGQFKIKNKTVALQTLNRITEVLSIINRLDRTSNRAFIAAYTEFSIHPDYNHNRTVTYLKNNKEDFKLVTADPAEFYNLLNKIN